MKAYREMKAIPSLVYSMLNISF